MKRDLVSLDCPWPETGGGNRGADAHYDVVPYHLMAETIIKAPVWDLADDAWVCMWTTTSSLPHSFELGAALGLRYVTRFAWIKCDPQGQLPMGIGQYARQGQIEDILVFRRGRPKKNPDAQTWKAAFDAPVGRHSEKPAKAYQMMADILGHQRVPLAMFERGHRAGWDVWGAEAPEVLHASDASGVALELL